MNYSTKEKLGSIASHLPSELIPPRDLSNLYLVTQILPPYSNVLFECRLGSGESKVDISIPLPYFERIPNPDFSIKLFEPKVLAHPVWQHYQTILHRFDTFFDTLVPINKAFFSPNLVVEKYLLVRRVWLEFDVEEESLSVPIPAIGLEFPWIDYPDYELNLNYLLSWAADLLNVPGINEYSDVLKGNLLSQALTTNLKKCHDFLPTGSRIIFLGAGPSRQTDALRLIISGIPSAQISIYLAQIGWIGSTQELDDIISSISMLVDNIVLSFNVGEIIFPRIGLECYLINPPQQEPRWRQFLEYLVKAGLCTRAKCEAFLAWLDMDKVGGFERFTACIKVTYQPGLPLEAKGYLGMWS